MTVELIRTLYQFNYWAPDRVFAAVEALSAEDYVRDLASSFPSVRDTLTHIYFGEWIWYNRWRGHSPTSGPPTEQFAELPALRKEWTELQRDIAAFVGEFDDAGLDRMCTYRLLSGAESTSSFREMFLHLVNHGSYHRGQIGTMLRQLGAKPAQPTDMIAFFRERATAA